MSMVPEICFCGNGMLIKQETAFFTRKRLKVFVIRNKYKQRYCSGADKPKNNLTVNLYSVNYSLLIRILYNL